MIFQILIENKIICTIKISLSIDLSQDNYTEICLLKRSSGNSVILSNGHHWDTIKYLVVQKRHRTQTPSLDLWEFVWAY